jgi:hypothetical protein
MNSGEFEASARVSEVCRRLRSSERRVASSCLNSTCPAAESPRAVCRLLRRGFGVWFRGLFHSEQASTGRGRVQSCADRLVSNCGVALLVLRRKCSLNNRAESFLSCCNSAISEGVKSIESCAVSAFGAGEGKGVSGDFIGLQYALKLSHVKDCLHSGPFRLMRQIPT